MYAAAKILTLEATQESGPVRELLFLREITKRAEQGEDEEGLDYLPALHDDFFIHIPAEDPARVQRHLCLVQTLYSTSVSALRRSAPTKSLPIYMVRNVIHMTLRALEVIHSLKIVHTGK
jgi:serine/threonine-protein kinase SRPK3